MNKFGDFVHRVAKKSVQMNKYGDFVHPRPKYIVAMNNIEDFVHQEISEIRKNLGRKVEVL